MTSPGQNVIAAGIWGPELLILILVVVVLFGGSQIPKLARSIGQAQKEFKKGQDENDDPPGQLPPSNPS